MAFCAKCGNQLKDGDAYCAKCGTQIQIEQVKTVENQPQNEKTTKKVKIVVPIVIILAIVCLITFIVMIYPLITESNLKSQVDIANIDFISGNIGLNNYLMEGMPPEMIYDAGTGPFAVGIAIENQGEADVGPGTDNPFVMVRLEGFKIEDFGLNDSSTQKLLDAPLKGVTRNVDDSISQGEITVISFEPLNYIPDLQGNSQFTIRADICYDYETSAAAIICLKDNVSDNAKSNDICSLSGEKNVVNSGSPLHVTRVVENPVVEADNKIQINFVVEHVGMGEFFGRPAGDDTSETCDFSITNDNKYYVDVEVLPLQNPGWIINCSIFGGGNNGRIKLYQGAPTTISCTIEHTGQNIKKVYEDLLNIKLKYRYGQFIETPIIIQDATY